MLAWPRHLLPASALSLIAGVVVGVAFPPHLGAGIPFPPLLAYVVAVAAVAAYLRLLAGRSLRAGLLLGLVFGVGLLGVAVRWLSVIGSIATVPLVLFEALFFALSGLGLTSVLRLRGWRVWVPAVWVLGEGLRSRVPFGGFTWGRLGYLGVDTPFAGWAKVGAVPLTSFVVVLLAATLLGAVRVLTTRPAHPAPSGGHPWRPTVALAVLVAVLAVSGSLMPAFTRTAGQSTVAVVQGSVPGKGLEFLGRARTVTRNHLQATTRLAAAIGAGTLPSPEFVIWPENSTDIDPLTDTETAADIDAAVAAVDVPILVGAVLEGPGPREVRNVGLVWNPGSGPGEFYVKRHLVPFGEYVPLRSILTPIVPILDEFIPRDMVAGTRSGALDIAGVRIGDMLCFDTAYDDAARADVVDGARMLVVQTNNATYTGTGQPDQQWQITRFDALAFGRTTAVASTNGRSGVIAFDGSVVATLPVIEQGYLSMAMPLRTGHTPAVWLAGWLELVLATVGGLAVLAGVVRRRRV
jgi:apolipoprotein N-acyltransferase